MRRDTLDLLREVLDHEIVDSDGVSCGMVDDIELSNSAGGPVVKALLVGPGAWLPRVPAMLRWFAGWMFGHEVSRVPWNEVAHVAETIQLKSKASTLQLGRLDRRVGTWLSHIPKS
jgi:sporulation protein YlmC with PRC-barrel domain